MVRSMTTHGDSTERPSENTTDAGWFLPPGGEPLVAELVAEPVGPPRPRRPLVLGRRLPLVLFAATCVSVLLAGTRLPDIFLGMIVDVLVSHQWPRDVHTLSKFLPGMCLNGLIYGVCVMTILVCHEMGHWLQARRYRVPATLPLFVPMPIGPIGTLGAVIAMRPGVGDRRAIFDIGITGPLAGLVPTLIFAVVGLLLSEKTAITPRAEIYGDPLLMQLLERLIFGPLPPGHVVASHPMAFAAWVGLLVTSINLIPIGQLDGGHVLYGLLRQRAHYVASFLLTAAAVAVVASTVFFHYPAWFLMVLLLLFMGPKHPPTANDDVPLGPVRIVLGWLTLAFVLVGFTPMPFPMP
jgi:Zn-dependent protease